MHKVSDHITNSPCESFWTVISITKYSGEWFDLSLNSIYWIKLFFSLKIIAGLQCLVKPLPSEFIPMLHGPLLVIIRSRAWNVQKQLIVMNWQKALDLEWPEFKPWLLFCVTNWMVPVKWLASISGLMWRLNEKVYFKNAIVQF